MYFFVQGSDWSGMLIKNPFSFADGVVAFAVPGVASLGLPEGHSFPLITDSPLEDVWLSLETQVLERFAYEENHTLVRMILDEGKERVSKTNDKLSYINSCYIFFNGYSF